MCVKGFTWCLSHSKLSTLVVEVAIVIVILVLHYFLKMISRRGIINSKTYGHLCLNTSCQTTHIKRGALIFAVVTLWENQRIHNTIDTHNKFVFSNIPHCNCSFVLLLKPNSFSNYHKNWHTLSIYLMWTCARHYTGG